MEIILSTQCESLTGSLGKGYGYYIRRAPHKDGSVRFYSQRSKWNVPPDGHMRFIFTCAELAQMGLHIADIKVSYVEFYDAVREAEMIHKIPAYFGWDEDIFMNAKQVLNTKEEYDL